MSTVLQSTNTPTAPLPALAEVASAASRHKTAQARYTELLAIPPVRLTDREFEDLLDVKRTMADAAQILRDADMMHLLLPTHPEAPTAPLSADAARALARLERTFLPLDLVRAVTRYETAALRYDELIARPASQLKPAEVTAIGEAQQTIAESLGVLADAGRLDLIAPVEVAARYRQASAHYRRLAACGDYEGCEYVRDEMGHCRCQLEAAGRLDLIGGAL